MKKLFIMLLMIFSISELKGQPTEIIPYRLVPSQDIGYGCWLDLEVVSLPYGVKSGSVEEEKIYRAIVKKEVGEIGFNDVFVVINNKSYVLLKIQVPETFDIEPRE